MQQGLPRRSTCQGTGDVYPSQDWRGETKTRIQTHTPETQARNGVVTAKTKRKHTRHTTVANQVSIARTLRQPVPCK